MISGIYKIENRVNKKKYIGSSVDILRRWGKEHKNKLNNNKHKNAYLQNAWNKYGAENFTFVILEDRIDMEKLESREDIWMIAYECLKRSKGYNIRQADRHASFSEETRKKMSEAKRGFVPWMKGRHHTEEAKKKMSKIRMGISLSAETKKRMSKAHNGMKHSEETIEKISESHIGNKNYMYGKKHSKESIEKMSEFHKSNPNDGNFQKGNIPWMKGKRHSEEAKRKLSKAHTGKKLSEEHKRKIGEAIKRRGQVKQKGENK